MAKRGLCILLAVLTLFALAIPAFAEEEPIATEEPAEVPEVTEAPEEIEEPEPVAENVTAAKGVCGAEGDGSNLTWTLSSDGVLTISGEGEMADYWDGAPWDSLKDQVKKVVIKSGVTSIGNRAFGSPSLTSVTIPESVTSIGVQSLAYCPKLTDVTIPASVTSIGEDAFFVSGITDFVVAKDSKSYTTVDGVLFSKDKKTLIRYPEGKAASAYTIPDTVVSIETGAFYGCKSLTSVTIPASVTSIGKWAFGGSYALTSITVLNPNCKINTTYDDTLGVLDITVVSGYAGSTAEAYAKKYGYTFKPLDQTPSAPSTLAAPKLSKVENVATGVKIAWGKVTGAAKYRVFYKGGGKTGWTKLKDTADTSYTWTKAKSGTKYTFTVRCVSEDGESYTSAYDTKGKTVTYVAAPTVKIANAADGIKVTWDKVKGASRYTVYYKEGSGGWKKIGTTKDASTSYTWAKAQSGKTYTFTVRAADANKDLLSAFKASNTLKYVAAPTVKIAKATDGIKVTWDKVKGASRYTVYYKEGNGGWKKIGTTKGASTSYTWTKAQSGKTYTFTVRAADASKNLLSAYKASNSLKYKK